MNNLEQHLIAKLKDREAKGILRKLKIADASLVDFTSNDYLGLANSAELRQIIKDKSHPLNLKNGATGSRLLSGNSSLCEELESKLANLFVAESCLIFNSGYSANTGVLSAIPSRSDTILYDELCHASIKDGVRLSLATKHSFKHNDLGDLEQKIQKANGNIFIVAESIYSMDGDLVPLEGLVALAEQYNCHIILDEAHSTGVLGANGAGLAVSKNLHSKIAIRIYTFGKAIGCHGACVAASKNIINYLINFSKPFIYTTALPDHTIIALRESFEFLKANPSLQTTLQKKVEVFKKIVPSQISSTAIQTVICGSVEKTKSTAKSLMKKGFDVRPIFSPTVPEGTERLRICIHTFNSDEEITELANQLTIE
jgi:8-amino-7-oxononanoate synthase